MKKLVIGCDHAAFELKEKLKSHLIDRGFAVEDVGAYSTDSCDYPVFAAKLCQKILCGEFDTGILLCGTGIGMSIAANKYKGIRAACCSDTFSARMAREHNNANVLCIGSRVLGTGLAFDLADTYLDTAFEGGKHQRRVGLITDIENGKNPG